ncbi:hypothetical protein ACFO26_03905 [Lactococcus nasutitermitis]|uniref:Lipoprotein n=1 Tax=Lactococcus nasutitermitis TaxID=1652957 RepID=A0ABV9JDJ6_9LACT|nr:hypothetical protein [Lactococcus nasutitermitis]
MKKIITMSMGAVMLFSLAACSSHNATSSSKVQKSHSSAQVKSKTKKASPSTSSSKESKSSQSSSSSATTASSSSSTKSSTTATAVTFDSLTVASKNQIYATWLQNAQGEFIVYNTDAATTYFVNAGSNGTKQYENGVNNGGYAGISLADEMNSAKFVISGDSVSLYVLVAGNSFDGNWDNLKWMVQTTLTKEALMQEYYQTSLTNKQIVLTKTGLPN